MAWCSRGRRSQVVVLGQIDVIGTLKVQDLDERVSVTEGDGSGH